MCVLRNLASYGWEFNVLFANTRRITCEFIQGLNCLQNSAQKRVLLSFISAV